MFDKLGENDRMREAAKSRDRSNLQEHLDSPRAFESPLQRKVREAKERQNDFGGSSSNSSFQRSSLASVGGNSADTTRLPQLQQQSPQSQSSNPQGQNGAPKPVWMDSPPPAAGFPPPAPVTYANPYGASPYGSPVAAAMPPMMPPYPPPVAAAYYPAPPPVMYPGYPPAPAQAPYYNPYAGYPPPQPAMSLPPIPAAGVPSGGRRGSYSTNPLTGSSMSRNSSSGNLNSVSDPKAEAARQYAAELKRQMEERKQSKPRGRPLDSDEGGAMLHGLNAGDQKKFSYERGFSHEEPDNPKATQRYLHDLEAQILEKKDRERLARERRIQEEREEAKREEQYSPWGREGAGAPLRKADGSARTDLRGSGNINQGQQQQQQMQQQQQVAPQASANLQSLLGMLGGLDLGALARQQQVNSMLAAGNQNNFAQQLQAMMLASQVPALPAGLPLGNLLSMPPAGMASLPAAFPTAANPTAPANNTPSTPQNANATQLNNSHLRGLQTVDSMPDSQKAEFLKKQKIEEENREALKRQVEEKKAQKAKEAEEKRLTDIKEAQRLERDRKELEEKFARDEQLRKQDQLKEREDLAKQADDKEKFQSNQPTKISPAAARAKAHIQASMEAGQQESPVSNHPVGERPPSPPLPTMKGPIPSQPSAASPAHVASNATSSSPVNQASSQLNNASSGPGMPPPPALNMQTGGSSPQQGQLPDDANRTLLAQLSTIQKELQQESMLLSQALGRPTPLPPDSPIPMLSGYAGYGSPAYAAIPQRGGYFSPPPPPLPRFQDMSNYAAYSTDQAYSEFQQQKLMDQQQSLIEQQRREIMSLRQRGPVAQQYGGIDMGARHRPYMPEDGFGMGIMQQTSSMMRELPASSVLLPDQNRRSMSDGLSSMSPYPPAASPMMRELPASSAFVPDQNRQSLSDIYNGPSPNPLSSPQRLLPSMPEELPINLDAINAMNAQRLERLNRMENQQTGGMNQNDVLMNFLQNRVGWRVFV